MCNTRYRYFLKFGHRKGENCCLKRAKGEPDVVAHTFYPSTGEAEAGRFLSLLNKFIARTARAIHRNPVSKNKKQKNKKKKKKKKEKEG